MANSAPLQDIKLRNQGGFDFDLTRILKVECNGVIGFSIYGFLFMYIVTSFVSLTFFVAFIAPQNVFSDLLALGLNYEKMKVH